MSINTSNKISHLKKEELLPLVCAAAALREDEKLKKLILECLTKGIKKIELYESLLQNYLFTGYPSAMVSLKILSEYTSPDINTSLNEGWDLNKYRARGTKNCKKIYGQKFDKLISNVEMFSPELSDWLMLEGYGKVMGRKGLSLKKRELNNVAVLTVLKFDEQLYSHINGAFRTGSSIDEISSVILNLDLFEIKGLKEFGMKTIKKYIKKKGTG